MNSKDSSSKRVRTLCRLSPSNASCVKYLKFTNGRCITVFSAGNKLLHIMENYKIIFIINMGSSILKVLDYVDERNEIWVVTKDGKLWAIPISLIHENEQTKQQTSYQATKASPNHEIFAELLGDHAHSSEDQTQNFSVFNNIHQCSHDHVIYWEEGLQDAVIDRHHIITCSSNDGDLRVTVYPWVERNIARKQEMASSFLYQTVVPSGTCNHDNNSVARLLYVSSSSKCANSTLNKQLFDLFSSQSGGNCPVVLVGLHSGLVGYIHVGVKNQNPPIATLYHLEQPVLSIFPVCRKPPSPKSVNSDTTETANTLCILGTLGKLVLITQDNSKGLPDSTVVQEYHVPGPILCAASNLHTLFYSTLKVVYAVQFEVKTENKSVDKGTSEVLNLPSSLSPTSFNISKVLALSIDDANSMICLKTDGQVLLVPQQLAEEVSQLSSLSDDQIKKHLGEIHEKASQVKNLHDEIHQLDEVIKQLNSVTQILCEILRNREPQNESTFQESRISFKVGVDYEAQGTSLNPCVILRCELINSTKFPFSQNWSLVVQVDTSQPWFNEDCSVRTIKNHSVSLSPASSHHISIPMEDTLSFLTPIHISCYVCFGLKELLPVFLRDHDPVVAEEGFSILVSRVEMNILHFLRKQDTYSSVTHQHRHPTYLLQNTLKSNSTSWSPDKVSEPVQENSPEFSTLSIELSKEAVDLIQTQVQDVQLCKEKTKSSLKPKTNGPNHRENKDNISSKEACVLYFILHGSRKYLYCDNKEYPSDHVVARTPKEEVVKFQVVEQVGTTQGIEGLEVHVHTSSQALGCSVHSSLLNVLKPVLQRTAEQSASVPVGGLQKQLIKLKELQMSLNLMRPSFHSEESMEESTTCVRSIQKLLSIYGELRKIPTTIL